MNRKHAEKILDNFVTILERVASGNDGENFCNTYAHHKSIPCAGIGCGSCPFGGDNTNSGNSDNNPNRIYELKRALMRGRSQDE